MNRNKTFKITGILIVLVGLFVIGLEVEQNLSSPENDYSLISAGLINILLGITILGSVQKNSK